MKPLIKPVKVYIRYSEKTPLNWGGTARRFKLDNLSEEDLPLQEWGSGWPGPEIIVEIQETAPNLSKDFSVYNSTTLRNNGPKLIVRTEEVLIVLFVLLLWVGAIALFFNRWGKIRMLEPYQPKFQQQHRASCSRVDIESVPIHQRTSISRMSMAMAVPIQMPPFQCSSLGSGSSYNRGHGSYFRPRQNSVFVTHQVFAPKLSRKTRSAVDIHSIILDEEGAEAV